MQGVVAEGVRGGVYQSRDVGLRGGMGGEEVGEEGGVVSAAGVEEEFGGGGALGFLCWLGWGG